MRTKGIIARGSYSQKPLFLSESPIAFLAIRFIGNRCIHYQPIPCPLAMLSVEAKAYHRSPRHKVQIALIPPRGERLAGFVERSLSLAFHMRIIPRLNR